MQYEHSGSFNDNKSSSNSNTSSYNYNKNNSNNNNNNKYNSNNTNNNNNNNNDKTPNNTGINSDKKILIPLVRFSNANGSSESSIVVPILPQEFGMVYRGNEFHFRTQIPLKLAWALTIHKCQGKATSYYYSYSYYSIPPDILILF